MAGFDEDDAADPAAGNDDAGKDKRKGSLGFDGSNVDEYLDDAATPVDKFLTATPQIVDSPEIFEGVDDVAGRTSVDELCFDDNTPLPEDFDSDNPSLQELDVLPETIDSAEEENELLAVKEPAADFALYLLNPRRHFLSTATQCRAKFVGNNKVHGTF